MLNKIKDILSKLGLFNIVRSLMMPLHNKYRSFIFKKHADKAFEGFLNIFEKLKINYWIEFGTLLGAIREKDFIEHDLDIDFAMKYEEKDEKLETELFKAGFIKQKEIIVKSNNKVAYEAYSYKNKFNIDIYYFFEDENNYIFYEFIREKNLSYGETIKKNGGLFVEQIKFPKFKTQKYKFKTFNVNIPENSEKHLIRIYGKDYMTPKKNWDFLEEGLNREKVNEMGILKFF